MSDALRAFGARWDKRARGKVAYDPNDESLLPAPIPLDMPAVDLMLGGGVPRGRTTVIFGAEAAGKTLLAQLIIAAALRHGGTAMYYDVERCFDPRWFALTGVDTSPDKLLVLRPTTLEQTFDMVADALVSAQPDVLVIDSVAALVPQDVLKSDMEKKDFRGLEARKITAGVKRATQFNRSTALLIVNQLRVSMGVTYGSPETMPGGRALRHAASLMIRVRRGAWLTDVDAADPFADDGDDAGGLGSLEDEKDARRTGFILKLRTEKSKTAPPWQTCELKFYFTGAVDPLGSLVHLALQRGVIEEVSKGYFALPGVEVKVHGRAAAEQRIRDDDELKERIVRAVREG